MVKDLGICPVRSITFRFRPVRLHSFILIADDVFRDYSEVTPIETSPGLELISPMTDPDSLDIRCGRGATTARNAIKTATVQAGDTIGFAAGEPMLPVRNHP